MSLHHELIRNEISTWSSDRKDEYYERCAILEYDAKLLRANAEIVAFQQMKRAERK